MQHLPSKRLVALVASVVAIGVVVAAAAAAVTSRQTLADDDGVRVRFERVVTDAAGFDSGWHVHPGLVIVSIEAGAVQFYQGSCTPKTYTAGDTIIEVPWKAARFVTTGAATWTTSFVLPSGQPLSVSQASYEPARPNPCP